MADNLASQLQNKEKFLRTLITLGLVVGGGYALYTLGIIMPFIINMTVDIIHEIALLALIGAVAYCVLDTRIRTFAAYIYMNTTRWLFSQFTNIDLIGTLRSYSSRMKEKLREVDKAIGTLRGQRDDLQRSIDQNEEELVDALKRAEAAKKVPAMKSQIALQGRKAGQLRASNVDLQKLLVKITALHDGFVKRREAMDTKIQEIDTTIDLQSRQRKSLMAGYRAMKAAQGVLDHNMDKEIYDMTLEKLSDESAQMMGEIDTFMDVSKKINDGIDLDNMVFEDDAMQQLDAWENSKSKVRVDPSVTSTPAVGDFNDLFEDDGESKQNKAER